MICEECGKSVPVKMGRVPKFCSGACRQRAYRRRRASPPVPESLTRLDRWTSRDGKRPVQADGRAASSTDPTTWASYAAVAEGPCGIMLGDGLACWDLDDVLDSDGRLDSAVASLLRHVASDALWVERSMSGRGLHVFVESAAPSRQTKRISFYSHSRFIAVTGNGYTGEL